MTKVLILNPPTEEGFYINRDQMGGMGQKLSFGKSFFASFLREMKSSFIRQPVLQLVYAATILNKNSELLVIDAQNQGINLEELIKKVEFFKPDFTLMAISSSDILYERDKVAYMIKQISGKIITVGDTIANEVSLFQKPFDISIIGEVENAIEKIVSNEKLEKIPGIIYFDNDKVKINNKKEFLTSKELDKLPFPDWDLFPYKKYRYYPLLFREPIVSMLSSRGCPYGCYYCSYAKNEGKILRLRTASNVVDEIEKNVNQYKIKGIIFRDPLFTGSKSRTEEICRLIIEKKLKLIWACETRIELLNPELLQEMYDAGCRAINLGIESIHELELKNSGRNKVSLKKIKEIITYCRKIGIRTTGFFILGLPGATRGSLNETIKFSIESDLNHAEYKIATPYPGTKLKEIAIKNKWIVEENNRAGGYSASMQISKELSPGYLNKLCDSAFQKFYYRPSWFFKEVLMGNNFNKLFFTIKTAFRILKNE